MKGLAFKSLFSLVALASHSLVMAGNLPGLWFGVIEVKQVNEVYYQVADKNTPKAVKYPFNLQILLHTDANGVTHLLREVFIMQAKAAADSTRVLITDPSRIKDFEGIIRRGDNKLAAVRLMSPSFDWGADTGSQLLLLSGSVANDAGSTISSIPKSMNMTGLHPLNPTRHQFHNEHKSGSAISRKFTITINAPITGNKAKPSEGKTLLKGTYRESIEGLHKETLKVVGDIQLTKVNSITVLNPKVN